MKRRVYEETTGHSNSCKGVCRQWPQVEERPHSSRRRRSWIDIEDGGGRK